MTDGNRRAAAEGSCVVLSVPGKHVTKAAEQWPWG